jgi:hypothetical protein
MLRILLDLYNFSGFLSLSVICTLLVRPHSNNVFVFDCNFLSNNPDLYEFMKNGLFTSCVLAACCGIQPLPLFKTPI